MTETNCVPDDIDRIKSEMLRWSDELKVDLILTTGGTGFAERDVTPEATKSIIHKETPGLVQCMISKSLNVTPMAMLSRLSAGIRNSTLIINLPGSKKASSECLGFVAPALTHAMDLLKNNSSKISATHIKVQNVGHHVCPHKREEVTNVTTDTKVDAANIAGRARTSPFPMISVEEAQKIVLSHCQTLGTKQIRFTDALGYILAEDVFAKDPLPPFPASIKDGYAVLVSDGSGNRRVTGGTYAGIQPSAASFGCKQENVCVRINTGAPVPDGFDAVVQVEDTKLLKTTDDGKEEVEIEIMQAPSIGQDIRKIGSDIEEGSKVLSKHSRLGPAEIGLLATVGATEVSVFCRPTVGILSTGNELQDPTTEPILKRGGGKIRDSNKTTLISLISKEGGMLVKDLGIAIDEPQILLDKLRTSLSSVDILVTTGGVSMGDRDLLRQVLVDDLNAKLHFARVHMKPGKPTTFATLRLPDSNQTKIILGLPGNPVSATVTCHLYVLPACRKISGYSTPMPGRLKVKAPTTIRLDARPEYQRVSISLASGNTLPTVRATGNQISSRLPSLAAANGLLMLPPKTEGKSEVHENDELECLVIGPLLCETNFA